MMKVLLKNNKSTLEYCDLYTTESKDLHGHLSILLDETGMNSKLIDLRVGDRVGDIALSLLGKFKSLQYLAVITIETVSADGLKQLYNCSQLQGLKLLTIFDLGVLFKQFLNTPKFLEMFPQLKYLDLTSCSTYS